MIRKIVDLQNRILFYDFWCRSIRFESLKSILLQITALTNCSFIFEIHT